MALYKIENDNCLGVSHSGPVNIKSEGFVELSDEEVIFSNLGKKFPDAAEYAEYQRARLAGIADPQSKDGLAKPHYDKLIDIITASGNIEGVSKTRLIQAYHYNMSYSLITKNNTAEAKEYAAKILAIAPDHTQAKQVSALK